MVTCATSFNDGKLLAFGYHDNNFSLYAAHRSYEGFDIFGHTDCIQSIAFSRDVLFVASCSSDCTIRIWDIDYG